MLSIYPMASYETSSYPSRRHSLAFSTPISYPHQYTHQHDMGNRYAYRGSSTSQHHHHHHQASVLTADDTTVAQALEIARESSDGAQDPTVNGILEAALAKIWAKVQALPSSYVMTRDEFAVFNFFQYRFVGNKLAVAARKRYWDSATGAAA